MKREYNTEIQSWNDVFFVFRLADLAKTWKPDYNIFEWQLTSLSLTEQYLLWLAHVFASRMPNETCVAAVQCIGVFCFSFKRTHIDVIELRDHWTAAATTTTTVTDATYTLHNYTSHMVLFMIINQPNILQTVVHYVFANEDTHFQYFQIKKQSNILQTVIVVCVDWNWLQIIYANDECRFALVWVSQRVSIKFDSSFGILRMRQTYQCFDRNIYRRRKC